VKKEERKVFETGIYKILIMAHMDFGACSQDLCVILKKEVRKLVETSI